MWENRIEGAVTLVGERGRPGLVIVTGARLSVVPPNAVIVGELYICQSTDGTRWTRSLHRKNEPVLSTAGN
jgi:hypothetical protein